MPRFFVPHITGETVHITGEDAKHMARVLRMKAGDSVVVCDPQTEIEHYCVITDLKEDGVTLQVDRSQNSAAEPTVKVHLYQAMPKGDKLELIIQKAVELGVDAVTPIFTKRCVSRPDGKSLSKKLERWQRIAYEAAKQSGRGKIPVIHPVLEYRQALEEAAKFPLGILFYECGGERLKHMLQNYPHEIAIFIGSEGGFEEEEVELAKKAGLRTATLGTRILRCETAPLCALSAIMLETDNLG